jgi:ubiquinone/menaquinone biosynthesis C-methylase UbiE
VDLEDYRRASLESWGRFATNWEAENEYVRSMTRPVSDRLIERLDPQPGETILELAAGIGETGFEAARRIGDSGHLISTDFAPQMVAAAERRGERLGLSNVEFRVLDAERMDLEDSSVDGVVARFGYMLMSDPAAALSETRRVLRESGRLAFAVWAAPDLNQWAFIPGLTLVEFGYMPPPEPGAPGIFAMADENRIRELVTGAGFDEPEIEQVSIQWEYADAAEHWEKTLKLAAPIADAVDALDSEERERVRATVAERIERTMGDDRSGLDGLVHVVSV